MCSLPTATELIQLLRQATGTDPLGTREMHSSATGGQSIQTSLTNEYVTQEILSTTLAALHIHTSYKWSLILSVATETRLQISIDVNRSKRNRKKTVS